MRLIHCADLHLDSKLTTVLSGDKLTLRRRELLNSFARLVEYANANAINVIMICGDFLDSSDVRQSVKNQTLQIINDNRQITFILISGNHDSHFDQYFYNNLPGNAVFLTRENNKHRIGEVVFTAYYSPDRAPELNSKDINIVLSHCQVTTYGTCTTQTLNLKSLASLPIDYLALGHVHGYACYKLGQRGVACYSGCLEGRGFDELNAKGFVQLEIANSKVSSQFVAFSQRCYYTIDVDISGLVTFQQITAACVQALNAFDKKSIIKLVLSGQVTNADIDIAGLSAQLSQIYFYVKVVDNTTSTPDANNLIPYTLRHEFYQEVMRLDVDDKQKQQILKYGFAALDDEEVDFL